MSGSMRSVQFRNFLFVLVFIVVLLLATLSMTINHQYKLIKSEYAVDQYDKKVDIFDAISSDIELITLCQDVINNTNRGAKVDEPIKTDCIKYPADLDSNLNKLSEYFNLDDEMRQEISLILKRNNPQFFDKQSIALTNQILDVLNNQLNDEEKQLGLSTSK